MAALGAKNVHAQQASKASGSNVSVGCSKDTCAIGELKSSAAQVILISLWHGLKQESRG